MKIKATCPQCRKTYLLADKLRGKKLKCKCGTVFNANLSPVPESIDFPAQQLASSVWEQKFNEIGDDLPQWTSEQNETEQSENANSKKPQTPEATKTNEPVLDFDIDLPMDPISSNYSYGNMSLAIAVLVSFAPIFMGFDWRVVIFTLPVFAILSSFYSIRANRENHMTLSIGSKGIAVTYNKRIPWPSNNKFIAIDKIEHAYIESDTAKRTSFLADAEHSHFDYTRSSRVEYVYIYNVKCKLNNRFWTTRVASMANRASARAIRLHLKRQFPGNNIEDQ